MSAGSRKHPSRLNRTPARNAGPRARIVADTLLLVWLGVMLLVILAAYTGVLAPEDLP